MSLVTPARSSRAAREGQQRPLDVVRALGAAASASQPPSAASSAGVSSRRVEVGGGAVGAGERDAGQRPGAAAPLPAERDADAMPVACVLVEPLA